MRTIKTRLILIFLGIALFPLIPIAWIVNDLVQQSYQIGVRPQVEEALGKGVEFSRQLYQDRKIQFAETLSGAIPPQLFSTILANPNSNPENFILPKDDSEWRYLSLNVYDGDKNLLKSLHRENSSPLKLTESHFAQLTETADQKIVLANREQNRFTALEKRRVGVAEGYVALQAAINDDFLETTDRSLEVYQMYKTLSISAISLPRGYLYAFLAIALAIILLTIAIAVRLSRRITQPIGKLVQGTQEVGRGNLDYRIENQGDDEIGELIRHFNSMAGDLKDFQEKTIYLEKMAAWQEIARRLAHEIKNPLTPIQLTMQEMVDQYQGKDQDYQELLQECHGIINEEIENLRRLVREFSDFGRLPELHLEEGDVNGLIQEVTKLYPHLDIDLQLTTQATNLQMDEDRIRRVLINLIENANQADPQNQPIAISTEAKNGFVEVVVEDRGKGIPSGEIEKIFQPYFTTKNSGIGLGLAITRKMIEEHDGEIFAESTVGKGSRFVFKLPVK